jgi:polyphosphate kinase
MTAASEKVVQFRPHGTARVPSAPLKLCAESDELFNRELSLLQFFRRVLEEAEDPTQPVLERLKFLAILSDNLDEFFMIRVSGLKETHEASADDLSPDGRTPADQLRDIREFVVSLLAAQTECLKSDVLPELESYGVHLATYDSLSETERETLNEYFHRRIYPVLTPQGVDPGHPFPYISGLNLNLGVMVSPVREHGITQSLTGKPDPRFVRIEIPKLVPRLAPVEGSAGKFVLVEEVISANVESLFPRMHPGKCYAFRVTRDADVEIREDQTDDLLRRMQKRLSKRRFGLPVRLEVSKSMPQEMVEYLAGHLTLEAGDVYTIEEPLDIGGLMSLYQLDRPDLKDQPFNATILPVFDGKSSIFEVIKRQDVLLHHPYNSYSTVTDFIYQAAKDPHVVAIKMCLYRTGRNSPIPRALIKASESGKQVTALVELSARFDEENNIEWAKRLEEAGVHVVYGLVNLKTHSKLTLVVRAEGEELKRYMHIATGNYNPITSGFYTDLGLLTADDELGDDATDLFNYLTGFSRQKEYRKLLVSPVNMRQKMLALIMRETELARQGRMARIIAKINRLADTEIIAALYEASKAGVKIDLIVRSICMLRPGVPYLSENISVKSIVGRFLEHSRIFYFANGGEEDLYIGSADWMLRNFDRRVEVVTPVLSPQLKRQLKDEILDIYLADNVKARQLMADGSYRRVERQAEDAMVNSQTCFFNT